MTTLAVVLFALVQTPDSLDLLFVGNSHTSVNNVPLLVESLALAGARKAVAHSSTVGGYALMEHAVYQPTLESIARGGWDYVVLQEQSIIPTIPYWRDSGMYPASRRLDSLIRDQAGRTALYMTWGWKYGGAHAYRESTSQAFADYFEMQDTVAAAYHRISDELGATLCPVGLAWRLARARDSLVDLWQADYCHATLAGSYLGACVFYAKLFESSPVGLPYFAGLDSTFAVRLQTIAWEAVSGVAERPAPEAPRFTLDVQPSPCRGGMPVLIRSSSLTRHSSSLSVFDSQGRLLLTRRVSSSSFVLGTEVLPAGTCFLRLDAGTGHSVARLVLQK